VPKSSLNLEEFESRKRDHIQHALHPSSQAQGLGGIESVHLIHEALPDLNLNEIRIETDCLSRPLATPFYIAAMTAGHADASTLNLTMAKVCQKRGWAMGLGSQRRELQSNSPSVDRWQKLREMAPDVMLFANLGISQLIETPIENVLGLARSVSAQAIAIHLNSIQECMQPEGTPQFRGAFEALRQLTLNTDIPIVVKETHWGRIEGARSPSDSRFAKAAETFANWGESTVSSVIAAAESLPANSQIEIWASGGVRSGLDAAKLIALGALRVGYAKPALEAALKSEAALDEWMELQEFELKVALFCTGCANPEVLRSKENAWKTTAV